MEHAVWFNVAVIALLDTTALLSDVGFQGVAWRVLAQAGSAWKVRVAVPEVAISEAVAGYGRRVVQARAALEGWARKNETGLGRAGADALRSLNEELNEAATSYENRLRVLFETLNVEITPPPEIPHMALVKRATSRQRPCDDNGDGYRDTLNWLTVLDFAARFPDERIAWVSDNIKDFGNSQGDSLHGDLVAELSAIKADNRVSWHRNLQELVLSLAAEQSLDGPADLRSIQEKLREKLLKDYVSTKLVRSAMGKRLEPRECGLPTATTSATVLLVGEPREFRFDVRGGAAKRETVVEFEFESETTILIELPSGVTSDDPSLGAIRHGPVASSAATSKPLRFVGLITLDRLGLPTGGELTRIAARKDDAGRAAWAVIDRSVDITADLVIDSAAQPEAEEAANGLLSSSMEIEGRFPLFASRRVKSTDQEPSLKREIRTVMWVDDALSNVVYEVEELESLGVHVIQVASTDEALQELSQSPIAINVVISDMGRTEEEEYNPTAGLELIRGLRGQGYMDPIFIYTSRRGLARRSEVLAAGGNGLTASVSELFSLLRAAGVFPALSDAWES